MKAFLLRLPSFSLLLCSLVLLAACGSSRTTKINQPAISPAGAWEGLLPCADCPGIDYTLTLHAGGNYEETMVYQERSVAPVTAHGAWQLDKNNVISLQAANNSGKQYFRFTGSELVMLDAAKKEIQPPRAGMFRLSRKPEGTDRATADRLARGIVFAATGNEPFWFVELDGDKQMFFKVIDGPELTALAEKEEQSGSRMMPRHYTARLGGKEVRLELTHKTCTDGMSGATSNWSARAVFTENGRSTVYQGCGDFLGNYQLESVWLLRQIDGVQIKPEDFPDGVPAIEFEMDEKRVSGFAGCNRFFGNFQLAGQELMLGEMGSTMMACPSNNMKLEGQFLEALSGQKLTYNLQGNTLRLSGSHTLVFSR